MPNSKIPKEDLEAFYEYCKQNPQAKEAVDKVIKAFSPDKIQTFLENCKKIPLPTDSVSYEEFCVEYDKQLRNVQEAPKVEAEKQEISAKRQEILNILTP